MRLGYCYYEGHSVKVYVLIICFIASSKPQIHSDATRMRHGHGAPLPVPAS